MRWLPPTLTTLKMAVWLLRHKVLVAASMAGLVVLIGAAYAGIKKKCPGVLPKIQKNCLFVSSVAVLMSCSTLTHWTKHSAHAATTLILLAMALRLAIALTLWRLQDGTFLELHEATKQSW